jgi:glycosyltransferase involved in cell wall biosynthesis
VRIVLVVGRSTGGIGVHVGELTTQLRGLGHQVVVVTDSLTADRFGWRDALRWWPVGDRAVRWLPRMRRLLASADVVHAHGLQAAALVTAVTASLIPPRQRPRFVVSLHNAVLGDDVRARLVRLVERRVVRSADLVTGASSDLVACARRLGAPRTELAPVPSPRVGDLLAQPVPTAQERSALVATLLPGESGDVPLVLTVSRIAPQKSLGVLVSAARQLRPPLVWTVIGDGDADLLAELESAAAHTGVRFLGARADVAPWLRAATVFVLPSAWEARPLVIQEAMAAGTPVVATDIGGLPDLVGGAGVLVPAASPTALAAAVEELVGDAKRRDELSRGGRAVARTWADGEATARQWVSWYAPDEN